MLGVSADFIRVRDVALFLGLTYVLSWASWIALKPVFPPLAIRTFIAMFGPMFGAVAVIRLRQRHHLRRERRVSRHWVYSSLLASAMAALITAIVVATGFALSLVTGDLKLPGSSGEDLFQALPIPLALLIYWSTAFGEEYGWRGFLTPALAPMGGARASIAVAVVFAAWHAPAILFDGFNFPRHHIIGMFEMLVFALPFTVVQSWLRSATRTVVAPAAAHATLNMLTGVLYASTLRTTSIIAAPVGLLGTVPFALLALFLLMTGRLWAPASMNERGRADVPPPADRRARRGGAGGRI
jgi:membrane protease YdiL (CAAX protease family)